MDFCGPSPIVRSECTADAIIFRARPQPCERLWEDDNEQRNQPDSREGLSIAEACAVAGIGRTKIYQAITEENGSLKARKCGKRTLILRDDLRHFLASLPVAA